MAGILNSKEIEEVFNLGLPMKIICDEKDEFSAILKGVADEEEYVFVIQFTGIGMCQYSKFELEIKGRKQIEFWKYRGEVNLEPIFDLPNYYKVQDIKLRRIEERKYDRIPYRTMIDIIQPVEAKGRLIDISGAGIYFQTKTRFDENQIKVSIPLDDEKLQLACTIVDYKFYELIGLYGVRCKFEHLSSKDKRHIIRFVKKVQREYAPKKKGFWFWKK